MKRIFLYCLMIAALMPGRVSAQDVGLPDADTGEDYIVIADPIRETAITVVASGTGETIWATGQPVSIVGASEIAAVQGADVLRVLERLPGVTASRNGGLGGFTGVRVRGAEAEQLLVLLDGVPLADPGSPGGGFDFGTLLPYGIDKIELLRGSNSTIWGSQAMGGVLAAKGSARDEVAGSFEYGAYDTVSAALSAGTGWIAGEDYTTGTMANIDAAYVDSAGISSAAAGTEPDGFRQWQIGGRAMHMLTRWLTLQASGRFAHARAEIDGFPAPAFVLADTAEYQVTEQASGRIGAQLRLGEVSFDGGYALADTRREQFDPTLGDSATYATEGRTERADLRGAWDRRGPLIVRFGGALDRSRFESTLDARKRASTTGAYVQLGYDNGDIAGNLGLRRDDHSRFGGEWSAGADGRANVVGDWELHASYGEAFKAPSLFQLFSDFGNAALEPERSRSLDLGFGLGDRNYAPYFDVTLFRRDTRGLIGFVSCFGVTDGICVDRPFGTYDNIGRARAQGIEVEGGVSPLSGVRLSGAYSFVEARDRTSGSANRGNDLARRPRHALTVTGEWQATDGLSLAADLRVVSHSYDDAANAVRLDGYEVLTLRANWDVSDQVALFGRVENVADEDYETAAGYATAGRGAYVGARARF